MGRHPEGGPASICDCSDLGDFRKFTGKTPTCFSDDQHTERPATMSQQETTKPVQVFRLRGVKISVFDNQSGNARFHKVAVHKIYREAGGDWKTTTTLGRDDLPIARMLIDRAWAFILDREQESNNE